MLVAQKKVVIPSPPTQVSCSPLKLKQDSSEDEALGEDEDPNIPESLNEMVDAEVSANPHDEANQPEVLEAVFPDDPLPQEEGDQEVEMTDGHAVPEERKANGVKIIGILVAVHLKLVVFKTIALGQQ